MAKENQVVADEVETPEAEPSLRDTILAARDEVVARQENDNARNDESRSTDRSSGASGNPDRGDGRQHDGRFVSRKANEGSDKQVAAVSGEKDSAISGENDRAVQDSANSPASIAPRSWKDEEKALWASIPVNVQAIINRRESDFHKQISQQGQAASVGNEFLQVANEFAPIVQARGGNPVAMFKDFMRIMGQLHSAPDQQTRAAVFQQVAAQQGVDLRALGIAPQAQVPNQQQGNQPQQVPLQTLVEQGIQARWQAWETQQRQIAEQAEMQRINGEIEAFKSKTNDQGHPLYPHFDAVTSLMASLMNSGVAATLEEAYPLAVKAHPETSKLLEAEAQAAARKAEEQRQAADKARRKAGSVRGSVGSVAPNGAGDRSLREELRANFAAARERL